MKKPEQMTPLFWGVFAAGGTAVAMLLVALIVIFGLLLPFGLIGDAAEFRANAVGFVGHGLVYLVLAGIVFTMLWHALHRFYYVLHDFHIHVGYTFRAALYTIALVAFLVTLGYGWF